MKQTDEAQLVEALTALSDGRLEPLRFDEMYMALSLIHIFPSWNPETIR